MHGVEFFDMDMKTCPLRVFQIHIQIEVFIHIHESKQVH